MAIYLGFAIALAVLGAYNEKFQSAALHWRRLMAGYNTLEHKIENSPIENENKLLLKSNNIERGYSEQIVPVIQRMRNLLYLAGLIVIFVVGFFIYRWYVPFLAIIGIYFLGGRY